jgi:hypothetical protein
VYIQNVVYMPSIRNSPWAKFTISMRPKIRLSPAAMRAYRHPMRIPLRMPWINISEEGM